MDGIQFKLYVLRLYLFPGSVASILPDSSLPLTIIIFARH